MIAIQVRDLHQVLMVAQVIIPNYRTTIACKTIFGQSNHGKGFNASWDSIYIFGNTKPVYEQHSKEMKSMYRHSDKRGLYRKSPLLAGALSGAKYEWNGYAGEWRLTKEEMKKLDDAELLYYSPSGIAYKKIYLHENKGRKVINFWEDGQLGARDSQRTGYPTQKALRILIRLIKAGTNATEIATTD